MKYLKKFEKLETPVIGNMYQQLMTKKCYLGINKRKYCFINFENSTEIYGISYNEIHHFQRYNIDLNMTIEQYIIDNDIIYETFESIESWLEHKYEDDFKPLLENIKERLLKNDEINMYMSAKKYNL